MIWTEDLKVTVDFYTEKLGFTCAAFREEWGWANLQRDEVGIMVSLPNDHEPFERPVFTGSFYIEVKEVDALWTELKDKVRVCYPLENFDYGMREFAVYDNNGYILQFGEEL